MKKSIIFILVVSTFGCVSESKYKKLADENRALSIEINKLKDELTGYEMAPAKLLQDAINAYNSNDDNKLSFSQRMASKYHPQSPESSSIDSIVIAFGNKRKAQLQKEQEEKEKHKNEILKALNRLRKENDDVSGTTWYKNPYFTHYNNITSISLYFGVSGSDSWLRLKMSYSGSDWIFFENAFLSYDGNTIEIPFDQYDNKESDNSGHGVWEWIDVSVSDGQLDFLRKFVSGSSRKMRLSGKYTETKTLTNNEIRGIKDVIMGYDALMESKKP